MDSEDIKRFKELYERKEHYGRNSIKLYDYIEDIIKKNNYKVILDYGCGNSILYQKLEENLKVKVYRYDPAIKGLEKIPPKNYDFVICSDVLHTVEEKNIDIVLEELKRISNNCFIYLNCADHPTTFYDGVKTNRCIHSQKWWCSRLKKHFDNVNIITIEEKTKAMFEIGGYYEQS